ncbi:MAG: aspartate--tRNA ligase [Lentisphaerae bacterium RIFOXYB12_FULL_65_16]|nr:MAG: aspartate--tRNA ligase [Lentisphaerae bacterium RIFOXYA12_64_32]OGV86764.1 MAG: aspartate--tRNA ligase [Lentisphaerae bacterium RIFOXYB12_FULL_65_16]
MKNKRTHTCGVLTGATVGQNVTLIGWINSFRDLGGLIFIDLRDREGVTQLVLDPKQRPELAPLAQQLRDESVITASGVVRARPEKMVNRNLPTGEIEVEILDLEIENIAAPLPFPLDDDSVNEDLRLKYRYLEMRRSALAANLRLRHRVVKIVRDVFDSAGFSEIETPIISKSTPEGARDYLIPSRVHPGKFYALPQAPQQYKQLLMVGGMERYFQIARCFRDEDLRADRQPEFTQIDVEMSFVDQEDIITLIEGMIARVVEGVRGTTPARPFPRLTYTEAVSRYGSDKPDTRFGLELVDLTPVLRQTSFRVFQGALAAGGIIKAINAQGLGQANRRRIDEWTTTAQSCGAKGLATLKVDDALALAGPVGKFLSDVERQGIIQATAAKPGDLLLLVADKPQVANTVLGRLRLDIAAAQNLIPKNVDAFLWVVNFPLLDYDETDKRYVSVHHPFTSPMDEDLPLLDSNPGQVRAKAYDVVLNGVELGGGSIRIHQRDLQAKMFRVLGISDEEANLRFGHLLEAFSYGAPPHGGIALGLDRFVMLLAGAKSIREVIAFPKTTKAACLMTDSPGTVDAKQLDELHVRCVEPGQA